MRGEQHLRRTGLHFGVARLVFGWSGYPASDAPGDEAVDSVELVEAAEETEELGRWFDLVSVIDLSADESIP